MHPEMDLLLPFLGKLQYSIGTALFLFFSLGFHEEIWTKNIISKISIKKNYFLSNSTYPLLERSTLVKAAFD